MATAFLAALLLGLPSAGKGQAVAKCEVTTAPAAVPFGQYDPTNTTVDVLGSTTFVVDCKPKTTLVTISLSAGTGGGFTPRAMLQGAWQLTYNLYEDAAMTRVWGDGSPGTVTRTTPGDQKVTQTVYGRVDLGQWVAVGDYTDTITMTVSFLP